MEKRTKIIVVAVVSISFFSIGTYLGNEIKKADDRRATETKASFANIDKVAYPKLPEHKLTPSTCIRATTSEGNNFEPPHYEYGLIEAVGEHDYQVEWLRNDGGMWEQVVSQTSSFIVPINCQDMESQVEAAIKGNGY